MRTTRPSQTGLTLLELMIGVVVLGLVVMGIYNIFGSQERSHAVVDQVAEMNQNLRVAMDLVTRDIRMAGYHLEGGVTTSGIGILPAIVTRDGDPGDPKVPDQVELIYAIPPREGEPEPLLTQKLDDPSKKVHVDNTYTLDVENLILVTDGISTSLFQITKVNASKLEHKQGVYNPDFNDTTGHNNPNPFPGYGVGSRVFQGVFRRYCVDLSDPDRPVLRRKVAPNPLDPACSGDVVAEYIENLQVTPIGQNQQLYGVTITARTRSPLAAFGGIRRKTITQQVKTRNIP